MSRQLLPALLLVSMSQWLGCVGSIQPAEDDTESIGVDRGSARSSDDTTGSGAYGLPTAAGPMETDEDATFGPADSADDVDSADPLDDADLSSGDPATDDTPAPDDEPPLTEDPSVDDPGLEDPPPLDDVTLAAIESGEQDYARLCAGCHGSDGLGRTARDLYGYVDLDALTRRVNDTMPRGNARACVGECASDVATFIFYTFQ